jgi:antitoxin VapB
MITAKIFTNGGSQAIRLPRQFRFEGKEVRIRKIDGGLLLMDSRATWDMLFESIGSVSDDFMSNREQHPVQKRKSL